LKSKIKFLIVALAVLALTVTGCGGNVVATVNNEKITKEELAKWVSETKDSYEKQGIDFSGDNGKDMLDMLQVELLEHIIDTRLMLQEARKFGDLTPEQLQEKLKPIREMFPADEDYNEFLNQAMLSEEEIGLILNLQEQVAKDVPPVTEEEAKKFFDQNIDMFSKPEQLEVRHILFFVDDGSKGYPAQHTDDEAKGMAEEVIALLNQGRNFAEIAAEQSEDSGTSVVGGLYTFSEADAVEEFSDAAFALKDGEYTRQPVKTNYGYHVIKRENLIPASQETFEEVKQELTDQMYEQAKQAKFSQYMDDARSKAIIVNKLTGNEGE